ncbi:Similar to Early 94 kDa protein (Autographa californica nuclear polyhedrosis virus) [Cotesia congregata]|uniref:Similar to Early 94 kDa protein (Autographa californica nuclear polyhedrosis virus) n=1 Tax=Cotesia congregata TaxID=51543 RepID=A0A8J2HIQ4_COTCN|nr:Similar to Early 94 kDa protein (Autographa californica nuclear polyhedrosis virus) [Cotesia congregata]
MSRVLSLPKLFIECVRESKKYPTLREYVRYVSKRKKFHGDLVTVFPFNVFFQIKNVHERYQEVLKKVKVKVTGNNKSPENFFQLLMQSSDQRKECNEDYFVEHFVRAAKTQLCSLPQFFHFYTTRIEFSRRKITSPPKKPSTTISKTATS